MKHLSKVIALAAVAALSVGSISAYAAPANSEMAKAEGSRPAVRLEMKKVSEDTENVGNPEKAKRGNKFGKEQKADKKSEQKSELAAKLEAGEITQEEYDAAIAEIETAKDNNRKMRGKGGKIDNSEKAEIKEMIEEETTSTEDVDIVVEEETVTNEVTEAVEEDTTTAETDIVDETVSEETAVTE